MKAVADTSPICYLILIDAVNILPSLFDEVLVPAAVVAELLHEDAPQAVRNWAARLPNWLSVRDNPTGSLAGLEKLQSGEQSAILLGESVIADVMLLDEKSARRVAGDRGLRVTGTLGILGEAASRGLVDLAVSLDRLRKTNFRCSPALLKATLDRFRRV